MNNMLKAVVRLANIKPFFPARNIVLMSGCFRPNAQPAAVRSLFYMSSNFRRENTLSNDQHSVMCSCGCGTRKLVHSKASKELVEFLTEEILAERKAQKTKTLPTELEGFKVSLSGAEVTLTKQCDGETIRINFNVNHSVDTDMEPEVNQNMDKPDIGDLKSKPSFKIDLLRGDHTVSLLCSFVGPNDQDEGYNDIFGIDEISIFQDKSDDNTYAVSGEVLDSYLYDLILNYLEEKGISNEFVEKLSEYSTAYEHSAYIGLLEGLSKFASDK